MKTVFPNRQLEQLTDEQVAMLEAYSDIHIFPLANVWKFFFFPVITGKAEGFTETDGKDDIDTLTESIKEDDNGMYYLASILDSLDSIIIAMSVAKIYGAAHNAAVLYQVVSAIYIDDDGSDFLKKEVVDE